MSIKLEKIINTAYSFGAAVVVFGAWAKLGHKDYSEIALTAGLLTEVCIFCIYGILEWGRGPASMETHSPHPETHPPVNPGPQQVSAGTDNTELTDTLKQTNRILNKVFKTE